MADGTVRCIDDEIPFEIPQSWQWERWGNISHSIQYGYNAPALQCGDIRMVRISDIQNGKVVWHSVPFCKISQEEIDTYRLHTNDILFARTGGTVGKSFLVEEVPCDSIYAGYLIRTRYSMELEPRYLKYFMESSLYWEQLQAGTIATAQPNCNGNTLSRMLIPIPPRSEQKRIIAILTQLQPLLDRYNVSYDMINSINITIYKELKKSILQEAIHGRLVSQDPNDEPASVLIERIREEKGRLVKEKKIKKDKSESAIFRGDDNKYYEQIGAKISEVEPIFEIPESWAWVKLPYIGSSILGKTLDKGKDSGMETPYLCSINVYWSGILTTTIKTALFSESEREKYRLHKGDLLICEGGDVGRCSIWNSETPMWYQNALHRVRLNRDISPEFIKMVIEFYKYTGIIDRMCKGVTIKHFTQSLLYSLLLPLPPKQEQERIVTEYKRLLQKL